MKTVKKLIVSAMLLSIVLGPSVNASYTPVVPGVALDLERQIEHRLAEQQARHDAVLDQGAAEADESDVLDRVQYRIQPPPAVAVESAASLD